MLALVETGQTGKGRTFEVRTRYGSFAGKIVEWYGKYCQVYFNSSCSRGSTRKFADVQAAADYIIARRIKKGWRV
jgi:hypothetical protein